MTVHPPSGRPPLPNSYWVTPGKLLGGEYPGGETEEDTQRRLRELWTGRRGLLRESDAAGRIAGLQHALPDGHLVLPSADPGSRPAGGPRTTCARSWLSLSSALAAGRCVYVHCRMGIGRTGMVLGCQLVQQGLTGEAALDELNRAWQKVRRARHWPSIPETREQRQYVASWQARRESGPDRADRSAGPDDRLGACPREPRHPQSPPPRAAYACVGAPER